jgi:hypothetical protein
VAAQQSHDDIIIIIFKLINQPLNDNGCKACRKAAHECSMQRQTMQTQACTP